MAADQRYYGGERVTVRDAGVRKPDDATQVSEFVGESGTVTGTWSGLVVVSLDSGPEIRCYPIELDDFVAPVEPTPAPQSVQVGGANVKFYGEPAPEADDAEDVEPEA